MSTDALDKLLKENPALYRALMEQVACEKSLYKFTEVMWEFVEPSNPFIGNWHLEAIAEHLEAVTNGEITRLLINIPPGPGWIGNSVATARGRITLGDVVVGDQVLTHKGRYKNVSAVHSQGILPLLKITTWNGRVTRAAPSHPYLTPRGWVDAADLVVGDVLAAISPQEDVAISRVRPEEARLIGYLVGDGSLTQATISFTNQDEDTIIDFENCAASLGFTISKRKRGSVTICNVLGGAKVHEWLGGIGLLNKNSYEKFIPDIILASGNETLRNFIGAYWSCDGMIEVRDTKKRGSIYRSSCCTVSERLANDIQHALTRLGMNARIRRKSRKLETKAQPGGVYKYIDVKVQNESDVALFADMPITERKLRLAQKCRKGFPRFITPDEIVSIESIDPGECKCLTVDDDHSMTWGDIAVHNTMKSLMTNVFWPAWEWIRYPHYRYISTSYSAGLTERDNIRFRQVITSDLYRAMWSEKFGFSRDSFNVTKVGNDKTGWKIATSTEGMGTGERGNRVLVDDPHNVKDGESEAVRKSTLQYFNEVLPTRVTDPIKSAMIVIMQRVHEEDVSGNILTRDLGYTHLMLPMEYEPDRKCYTFLPRQIDEEEPEPFFEDPRTIPGELLFPARMPDWVVERDKKAIGPYACTPAESPILMSDLTMKPICELRPGDEIVGFTTDTESSTKRRALTRSVVHRVYTYPNAEIMKITLKSGKVIRCTSDHKWYMGKQAKRRQGRYADDPIYQPAKIGRRLMRICDDHVPVFPNDLQRDAGWLAGFFDGEGSASNCKKPGGHRASVAINFYQTCEKNLPICDKLEQVLERLGFAYSVDDRKRPEKWQRSRAYRLTGQSLPLYQRFLHAVGPVKWRQRIEDGAYKAQFIIDEDEVVSIDPDGAETVYALETTTGNYVVWGLASSNSAGQFQQSPVPRGGGIIKREYWKLWPEAGEDFLVANPKLEYPAMDYIIASTDTAYSKKQEADYNAIAILGLWRKAGVPKIMLMHAWKKRLDFRGEALIKLPDEEDAQYRVRRKKAWGMLEWTSYECQRFGVDKLLIEGKATGITLAQEIRKVYSDSKWSTQLINPKGDKVSRVYSVQHIFAEGMVYAPERQWADDAITEMQYFPKGAHDDLTDAIVQGIRFLRDSGWALRREEVRAEEESRSQYRTKPKPLYDV